MGIDRGMVQNALKRDNNPVRRSDNGPLSGLPPTLGRSNALDDKELQNRLIRARHPRAMGWLSAVRNRQGGTTTGGQADLVTLGCRKVIIRIRKSAGLGYPCQVASPVGGFGEPHRNPTTQRHGGRSPQESHGRNGTLRYTCDAC